MANLQISAAAGGGYSITVKDRNGNNVQQAVGSLPFGSAINASLASAQAHPDVTSRFHGYVGDATIGPVSAGYTVENVTSTLANVAVVPSYRIDQNTVYAIPVGRVTEVVDPDAATVTNITQVEHTFYPGIVRQQVYQDPLDGSIHVQSIGIGIGNFGPGNSFFGPTVFAATDARVRQILQRQLDTEPEQPEMPPVRQPLEDYRDEYDPDLAGPQNVQSIDPTQVSPLSTDAFRSSLDVASLPAAPEASTSTTLQDPLAAPAPATTPYGDLFGMASFTSVPTPDDVDPQGVAAPEHAPGVDPEGPSPDGTGESNSPSDTGMGASSGSGYSGSGGGNNGISGPDPSTTSPDESPSGEDESSGGSRDSDSSPSPIQLDLSGKGLGITQLTQSNTFAAINTDGYEHRTAWAAAGEAVLFVDPNGLNGIRDADQYIFTDWDPSAKSDMDALRDVFDTDHDGKLDAGDAAFDQFKLMVTNADGTTTVETLAQAGIASIDLVQSSVNRRFADGSAIDGEAAFTRTDGTTGTAASVTYAADNKGYAVQTTTTANGDGSTTVDNRARNADGSLNSDTSSTTSADGATRTIAYDSHGTGVVDRSQTITEATDAQGRHVETVSDYDGGGQLRDSTTTTTSDDGAIRIERDTTGGGVVDQIETRRRLADGDIADIVSDVGADGTEIDRTYTRIGADGLGRDVEVDHVGGNAPLSTYDHSTVYRTTVAADGTRTETIIGIDHDQSHTNATTIVTAPDAQTRTTSIGFDGDAVEQVQVAQTSGDGAGGVVTRTTTYNGDRSRELDGTVTTVTANGLSVTTAMDMDGDGDADRTTADDTTVDRNGGRTEDVSVRSADGTLLTQTISSRGADGVSRDTVTLDADGHILASDTIKVGPQGGTHEVSYTAGRDGTILGQTERFTSADGLTTTARVDDSGDGTYDRTIYDRTIENSDGAGGSTEAVTAFAADGKLLNRTVTRTSADGQSVATQVDSTGALNGDGSAVFDRTTLDYTVYAADGSRVRTQATKAGNGVVLSDVVTDYSPDRRSHSITTDANGDGHTTTLEQVTTAANGDITDTVTDYNYDVSVVDAAVRTTSADGLHVTTQIDAAGTGDYNRTTTDDTTIGDDGLRTEAVVNRAQNGQVVGETVTTTQSNGDLTTVANDTAGDGIFDRNTATRTSHDPDGGTTVTVTDASADGSVRDSTTTVRSGNGLSTEVDHDLDGDGAVDLVTATLIAYAAGGDVTTTTTDVDGAGHLHDETDASVSGDGLTTQTDVSSYGLQFGSIDYSTVDAKTVGDDGSRYDDLLVSDASGKLVRETLTTVQGNGLSTIVQVDVNGDGTFDTEMDDAITLDDDGGRTETTTMSGSAGMNARTVVRTSGNGLSKTVQSDAAGDGTVDTTTRDDTTINLDGSRHEAYAQTNADASLRDATTIDTSADGRHVKVERVLGADGTQAETIDRGDDGTVTDVLSDRDGSGAALGSETVTTSANGLVKVVTYRDGGGGVQDVQNDTRTLDADGSTTEVFSDQDSAGGVNAVYTTRTSGNGLEKRTDARFNGFQPDYHVDDITRPDADGTVRDDILVYNADGSERDETLRIVSPDGLETQSQTDETGTRHHPTITVDAVRNTDGSQTDTTTILNSDTGAQDRQDIVEITPDGRTTTLFSARDGDTTVRYKEQTVENADGTYGDKSQFISGDWVPNWTQIRAQTFDTTGGQTVDIDDYDATGALEDSARTVVGGNGLHKQTYLDTTGNGRDDTLRSDDTTIGGGGDRTESVSSGAAPGSASAGTMAYGRTITTSADGLMVKTETDDDGNGKSEKVETSVRGVDGTLTDTVRFYDNTTGEMVGVLAPDGSHGDSLVKTTSADGLTVTTSEGDLLYTKTYVASSNGSYTWSGTAQGQPSVNAASHSVDANGIDTWTSTYYRSREPADNATITTTIQISVAKEQAAIAEANAIYQTVLNRPMNDFEQEASVRFIHGGILDQHAFAADLVSIPGYVPTDAYQTVKSYYDNDYGHDPSASDLATYMQHASGYMPSQDPNDDGGGSGTGPSYDTYADVAVAIAEKAVNEEAGNGLLALLPNGPQATAMTVTLISPETAAMTNTGKNYNDFSNAIGKPSGNLTPGQISQFGTLMGDPNAASAPQVDFASASSSTSGQGTAVPGFFSSNGDSATAPRGGAAGPLVVNLAGGRVHTTDLAGSTVQFDDTGGGTASTTAWITADEGFLVLDPQGAQVTSGSAMIPTFAALARYDLDGDGHLTALEADLAGIKVWVDANADGVDEKGEVESFGQAGLAAIDLEHAASTGRYDNGNVIAADSTASFTNGTTGDVADAWLAYGGALAQGATYQFGDDLVTRAADGTASELLYGSGETVDAGAAGLTTVVDEGSNDVLRAGTAAKATLSGAAGDRLIGGGGADTFLASGDDEVVTTGTGSNTVFVSGANTTVDAGRGTSAVSLDGANDSVTGATASTTIDVTKGTGARIAATGSRITVEGAIGVEISGSGVAVTAAGGSTMTLDASNSTLGSDAASTVAVNGSNDALTLDRASKVSIAGTGETVGLTSGTVSLAAGASARVTGYGDFATQAAGSALTIAGMFDGVEVTGFGAATGLDNGSLVLDDHSSDVLTGGDDQIVQEGDTVLVEAGAGSALDVMGARNRSTLSDARITVEAGASTRLTGDRDVVGATATGLIDTLTGSDDRVTITGAGLDLGVDGERDAFTVDGGSLTLTAGSGVAVTGSNDVVTATDGSNSTIAVTGTFDTVTATGDGDTIMADVPASLAGDGAWYNTLNLSGSGFAVAATGAYLKLAKDTSVTLTGSGDGVALRGSDDAVTVIGSNDSVFGSASGSSVTLKGSGDAVSTNSGTVTLADGIAASVGGICDTVDLGTGDTLTLDGVFNTVSAAGGADTLTEYGSHDALSLGGPGSTLALLGDDDSVTGSSASTGDAVTVDGTGETVALCSATVAFGDGASAGVTGDGDAVTLVGHDTLTLAGTGDSVTATGQNDVAAITGDGNGVTLTGSNGTLTVKGRFDALTVVGDGDTIDVSVPDPFKDDGACYDTLNLSGTGESVTACGASVRLGAGSSATLAGSGDGVILKGGDTLVVSGRHVSVAGSASGNDVTLQASGDSVSINSSTLNLADGVSASAGAVQDAINLGSADVLSLSGVFNTVTVNGSGDVIEDYGWYDTIDENGTNATVTLAGGRGETVNAGSATVVQAGDGSLSVYGGLASSVVTASGAGIAIALGRGDVVVDAAAPSAITGYGAGGLVSWQDVFDAMSGALKETDQYGYNASNSLMEIDRYGSGGAKAEADLYDPKTSAEIGSYLYGSNGGVDEVVDLLHGHDWLSQSDGSYKDRTSGAVSKTQPTLR